MIFVWQKNKIWLFVGMLYVVYYLIKSSKALKRLEIPRINLGTKS
ncbi:hypothetical protein D1BOALGB6SA_8651 [Olavius sp. associated proteobacterium Delta 1]|nr:hypothetical protein D1BOALGB6SA_8651 [Olavius sp. associated proteobacterium Delta 1]